MISSDCREAREPDRTEFATERYCIFCYRMERGKERAQQHEFGFTVKESIIHRATGKLAIVSERPVSATLNVAEKSNVATSMVAHAPTDSPK